LEIPIDEFPIIEISSKNAIKAPFGKNIKKTTIIPNPITAVYY
jgi:hypothetical protein